MSNDPVTDQKVKRKLIGILASWYSQYKDDTSMKTAANLYKQHRNDPNSVRRPDAQKTLKDEELEAAKRKNKEEARRKEKEEAERLKREKEERKKKGNVGNSKSKRKPFNFEEVP